MLKAFINKQKYSPPFSLQSFSLRSGLKSVAVRNSISIRFGGVCVLRNDPCLVLGCSCLTFLKELHQIALKNLSRCLCQESPSNFSHCC